MLLQLFGRSAPRVASTVPMSIVIVVASCASGVALVLILIGVAGAVRCRRVRGGRRRRTSGGVGRASKRLPVNTGMDYPELNPFDAAEQDGDIGLDTTTADLVDCSACQLPKHRRGRVVMNGVKAPAHSPICADESSVCIQVIFLAEHTASSEIGSCQVVLIFSSVRPPICL